MKAVEEPKPKASKRKAADSRTTIVLLDMHAILHRAYHALPDFSSAKGEPTGALYGLVAMLLKLAGDVHPDYVLACYDLPQKTYRHEAYTDYKAGRAETDVDLAAQIERSRDVLTAFSIPYYAVPGFEADDLLGTFASIFGKLPDTRVVIASGDMDTLQLVIDDTVVVYTLKKGINDTIIYDEAGVNERYGFGPKQLVDFKGLRGDPSDNIIGVRGVGEKTATALIQQFGSVEKMYAALEKKGHEKIFDSIGVKERMRLILKENKEEAIFSKMLATIRTDAPVAPELPEKKWKDAVDPATLEAMFDTLSFKTLKMRVRTHFGYQQTLLEETPEAPAVVDDESWDVAKVAYWLIDSNRTNPTAQDVSQAVGTTDAAEATKKLVGELEKLGASPVFDIIEKPLLPIVRRMNSVGVMLDLKMFSKLAEEFTERTQKLERQIVELAGEEVNVNSPKQLGDILFTKLGLGAARQKKTAGGALSTKESELEKIKDQHPIVPLILEYREAQKILSTYIDVIPALVSKDGRLRATFLQMGSTTGRMSSRDPNMQNLPSQLNTTGPTIRHAFISSPGKAFLAIDYSQIELRIAAILSDDPGLISVFKEGKDIHAAVASRVFGVPEADVTKEMRRQAKVINFGILYGMGVNALRENLGTDRASAQKFYEDYFVAYPGLAGYLENTKKFAAKHGYTQTLFGRRRLFPGITSKIPYIRASAERMAINAPIQGTATADIIKKAMVDTAALIEEKGWKGRVELLMQVHDELIFEVEGALLDEAIPLIASCMEKVLPVDMSKGVPIEVNASVGDTLATLKKIA
jgi:DNA polymerase-1